MPILSQPHDKFFREVLQNKENAYAFLQKTLPAKVLQVVDLNSLAIEKDSFISDDLKEQFTDLLYSVNINQHQSYIYLLFEHKSYHEPKIALQLLRYMLECWTLKCKQKEKLPLILPIVFYHDKTEWKTGLSLADIVDIPAPEFLKYFPNFTYEFIEASEEVIAKFENTKKLQLMLSLFHEIRSSEVLEHLSDLLSLIKGETTDVSFITSLSTYVLSILNMSQADFVQIIRKSLSEEGGNIAMSTAQKLWEEGKLEGKQEGRLEGIQEGIQQGILGMQESVQATFDVKFQTIDTEFTKKLNQISNFSDLKKLSHVIKSSQNIKEVLIFMDKMISG